MPKSSMTERHARARANKACFNIHWRGWQAAVCTRAHHPRIGLGHHSARESRVRRLQDCAGARRKCGGHHDEIGERDPRRTDFENLRHCLGRHAGQGVEVGRCRPRQDRSPVHHHRHVAACKAAGCFSRYHRIEHAPVVACLVRVFSKDSVADCPKARDASFRNPPTGHSVTLTSGTGDSAVTHARDGDRQDAHGNDYP